MKPYHLWVADAILALFVAHRDAEVEALRGRPAKLEAELGLLRREDLEFEPLKVAAEREWCCIQMCDHCNAETELERDEKFGWRHWDGEAHYRCAANDIREADHIRQIGCLACDREGATAGADIASEEYHTHGPTRVSYIETLREQVRALTEENARLIRAFETEHNRLRARAETAEKRLDENTAWLINAEEGYREEHAARLTAARERDEAWSALRKTLSAMDMQERRETGAFHISQATAAAIWGTAKQAALDSLPDSAIDTDPQDKAGRFHKHAGPDDFCAQCGMALTPTKAPSEPACRLCELARGLAHPPSPDLLASVHERYHV